jgi:hypothetical protein
MVAIQWIPHDFVVNSVQVPWFLFIIKAYRASLMTIGISNEEASWN